MWRKGKICSSAGGMRPGRAHNEFVTVSRHAIAVIERTTKDGKPLTHIQDMIVLHPLPAPIHDIRQMARAFRALGAPAHLLIDIDPTVCRFLRKKMPLHAAIMQAPLGPMTAWRAAGSRTVTHIAGSILLPAVDWHQHAARVGR